jgi:hypothetical protein
MAKIPFHIEGGANTGRHSPGAIKTAALVAQLPNNKLLTSTALADRVGTTIGVLTHWLSAMPPECMCKCKGKNLYGNPKTIAAFKKWQLQN